LYRYTADHNTKCPVCRTVLLLNHAARLPVNVTLASLMAKLVPEVGLLSLPGVRLVTWAILAVIN
jgi:hypothetical protein